VHIYETILWVKGGRGVRYLGSNYSFSPNIEPSAGEVKCLLFNANIKRLLKEKDSMVYLIHFIRLRYNAGF
jgi:hypothetical protein